MSQFVCEIQEVYSRHVIIESMTREEATAIAEGLYKQGVISELCPDDIRSQKYICQGVPTESDVRKLPLYTTAGLVSNVKIDAQSATDPMAPYKIQINGQDIAKFADVEDAAPCMIGLYIDGAAQAEVTLYYHNQLLATYASNGCLRIETGCAEHQVMAIFTAYFEKEYKK